MSEECMCEFAGWACHLYEEKIIMKEYMDTVCEKQNGYEIRDGRRVICQNKEGLSHNPNTFKFGVGARSDSDEKAHILQNFKERNKKTYVMYSGSMPPVNFGRHVRDLISSGLLYFDEKIRSYETTDLGNEYCKAYFSLRRILAGCEVEESIVMNNDLRKELTGMIKEKRRDTYGIVVSILGECLQPQTKTRIIQPCNLSYGQIKKYIPILQRLKLLELTKGNRYKTTERGKMVINLISYLFILKSFYPVPASEENIVEEIENVKHFSSSSLPSEQKSF